MGFSEFEIPVPWGHISVKAWGNQGSLPVLVLHGIQDNCGSFDRLIPLLPVGFYYVCIDLPGHGKSSHFPPGLPLLFLNYVYSVKLVIEHFKWNKLNIMGHSLGAQLSAFISSFYPEIIQKAIMIDGMSPTAIPEHKTVDILRTTLDFSFDIEQKRNSKQPPSYTFEEAGNRMKNNRGTNISDEQVGLLLKRGLTKSGNGYMYSVDQRLKYLKPLFNLGQLQNIISHMKCPTLLILAEDTYKHFGNYIEDTYYERLDIIFKPMKNFKIVLVEGNHDVHIIYPERVAKLISEHILRPTRSNL